MAAEEKKTVTINCPSMRAAGYVPPSSGNTKDRMTQYSLEEAAEYIFRYKCDQSKMKTIRDSYVQQSYEMQGILSPEITKSRFLTFRDSFIENLHHVSKPHLGKVRIVGSKPADINSGNTTFGIPTRRSDVLYDVVLPRKPPNEVNREFMDQHAMHVFTHKSYFPSERICRHYNDNYNPEATFGCAQNVDPNGVMVRRCLTNMPEILPVISSVQMDFLERTNSKLGERHKHGLNLPPDMTFATQIPNEDGVQSLIENIQPRQRNIKLTEAISHLNVKRRKIFALYGSHIHELITRLQAADTEKTGKLQLCEVFHIGKILELHFDEDKMRYVLKHFKMVEEPCEMIDYYKFYELLKINNPMPSTGPLAEMTNDDCNKQTTYREFCQDSQKPPMGDDGGKQQRRRRQRTTVKDLIQQEIPLKYGLRNEDFEQKRTKAQMRRIFQKVLDDKDFEEVWQWALNKIQLQQTSDNVLSSSPDVGAAALPAQKFTSSGEELLSVNQMRSAMMGNEQQKEELKMEREAACLNWHTLEYIPHGEHKKKTFH